MAKKRKVEKQSGKPSYEEGRVRDQSIEQKQSDRFQPDDLMAVVKKAVTPKPKP